MPEVPSSISATLNKLMQHIPGPLADQVAPVVQDIPKDLPTRIMETGAQVMIAIGLVILGWVVAKWMMERTYRGMVRARLNETAANFFASMLRFVVLFAFLGGAAIQLGGSAQMLLAIAGGLVVALGLGLKDTVAHVIGGVMLLLNRPFEVGDYVQVGELQGTVKRINLFQTEVNTLDNVRLFMPNKWIWDSTVQNYTHNRTRMVEVKVGFEFRDDTEACRQALQAAIRRDERILSEPEPLVGVDVMTDIGVIFIVRVWMRTADWAGVRFSLLGMIRAEAEARGLTLARHPMLMQALDVQLEKDKDTQLAADKKAKRARPTQAKTKTVKRKTKKRA